MYSAFVTRIKNLRKHSNADRLLCGECFGNTVIVGLDTVSYTHLDVYKRQARGSQPWEVSA